MKHILIVEDDSLLADCYQQWAKGAGYDVRWVADAQAALDALDEHGADVILLDMLLPGANGMQLLHHLQSYEDLQRIPVILCSNALPQHDVSAYGVVATLDKSTLTPQKFRQTLAEVLV